LPFPGRRPRRHRRSCTCRIEPSLVGTLGTLYIFYDLTQRLTLGGQADEHYRADLICTIKYD
jgi:hypothetical protein